jgi:hypothetical protein
MDSKIKSRRDWPRPPESRGFSWETMSAAGETLLRGIPLPAPYGRARAMVLAGESLFLAGVPDVIDPK